MPDLVLVLVLSISFVTDLRSRKILNVVTLPAVLIGVLYYTFESGWHGFLYSGKGALLGFAFLLIPYLMRGMGAGDVKLLAAVGALKGASFVFSAFLYTAAIGGLIAVLLLVKRRTVKTTVQRVSTVFRLLPVDRTALDMLDKEEIHHAFPYGVAIVLGTLCALGVGA